MRYVAINQTLKQAVDAADAVAFGEGRAEHAAHVIAESGLRIEPQKCRGRGAGLNPAGRFENQSLEQVDDGWWQEDAAALKTTVQIEQARSIITHNDSPDLPFERSINPYRGCEHGCIYCFARPSHSTMGLSAGLDFETRLFAKPDAAKILERELSKPGYKVKPIAIGTNTDPYQPIEKQWRLMRQVLDVLSRLNHPLSITTKSALIVRDSDILGDMAQRNLVHVALSVTTLDKKLARLMEPRASTPQKRLEAIHHLREKGVPVSVMVAPIISALNDHEIEAILEAAAKAGAQDASFTLLRLPYEVAPLFKDWLLREYPDRYRRVMAQLRHMRNGKDYDADWKSRMCGTGPFAELIAKRFKLFRERYQLEARKLRLETKLFKPLCAESAQLSLF